MKRFPILPTILAALLFSCNNEPAKEETKTAADTTATVAATPAETKPVFTPFKVVTIQSKVKNFEQWEKEYFSDDSLRKAYGITHLLIGRDLKDSNTVYAVGKMEDMEKARTFSKLPNLHEASKGAGLIGSPGFSYAEIIRENDSPTEFANRLGVAHHVKDFSAWLKVFDGEGKANRVSHGVINRSLARGLVDSNMIYITFVVSDLAKAKARMASPELKKIMTDAGVDSPPTIRWYKVVK